jgi:hypothetical protein
LPESVKKEVKSYGASHPIGGRNIAVSGQTVSLDIPVSVASPNNPVENMLWIQI